MRWSTLFKSDRPVPCFVYHGLGNTKPHIYFKDRRWRVCRTPGPSILEHQLINQATRFVKTLNAKAAASESTNG